MSNDYFDLLDAACEKANSMALKSGTPVKVTVSKRVGEIELSASVEIRTRFHDQGAGTETPARAA